MYLRTLLVFIVLGLVTIFSAINWSAFVTPTTLSMGFAAVDAPLGLILLAVVVLLTMLFLVYVAYMQSTVILDSRRHTRELQAQRELADQAEASRFNRLQSFLEDELQKLTVQMAELSADILVRVDETDRNLHAALEQSCNSLAAAIGELEDKVENFANGPS